MPAVVIHHFVSRQQLLDDFFADVATLLR